MTYSELVQIAKSAGGNLAELAIMRMMDDVGEMCGRYPDWDDEAPEWIEDQVMRGGAA